MANAFPVWDLFDKLRRRHRFPLSAADYDALRGALRAGFGWQSKRALCRLCCTLWAKSKREENVVVSLFEQLEWQLFEQIESPAWSLPDRREAGSEAGGKSRDP